MIRLKLEFCQIHSKKLASANNDNNNRDLILEYIYIFLICCVSLMWKCYVHVYNKLWEFLQVFGIIYIFNIILFFLQTSTIVLFNRMKIAKQNARQEEAANIN